MNPTVMVLLCLASGIGQLPTADSKDAKAESAEARALAKQMVSEYVFGIDESGDTTLQLSSEPVFRWNSVLGRRFYSDVYVWTHEGRPEVIASITSVYGTRKKIETEIHSLSPGRPILSQNGRVLWEPSRPGVEFKPVSNAPKPAPSLAARLSQMRSLATQFSVVAEYDRDKWDLRLLPSPICRYQSSEQKVLDGGLFVFAKGGTDPEAFLLIEARGGKDDSEWQFALVRFNGYCTLRADHDEQEVWRADRPSSVTDPKQPYFCLRKTLN
jgi:hypothetical protein